MFFKKVPLLPIFTGIKLYIPGRNIVNDNNYFDYKNKHISQEELFNKHNNLTKIVYKIVLISIVS